jgi:putative restriction endonuclease
VLGPADLDARVRAAAFAFLAEQTRLRGDLLPRDLLLGGFDLEGRRVPLLSPQGIFKPAVLPDAALSLTTVPVVEGKPRPYDDSWGEDGLIRYRYRGSDPRHRDNEAVRRAMERQLPLVYLHGHVPGWYEPVWPVFVAHDDPSGLTFFLEADAAAPVGRTIEAPVGQIAEARRRYVTVEVQRRLHQHAFRLRVLRAYREQCAICRLRHAELLDAAHILPDRHPLGEPEIPNGLSLCTLHHAAFDRHVIGVRPDLVVDVRADVLREGDGPMLRHGLQGFHGARLEVPRVSQWRPNAAYLEERYEAFRRAG